MSRGEVDVVVLGAGAAGMAAARVPHDANVDAGFVGAFDDDAVRDVLGLPPPVRPIGLIPIGYCAERPWAHPPQAGGDHFIASGGKIDAR